MLTGGTDPRIGYGIVDARRDGVEAFLLSDLIWVIQIKLIDEFIERHRKVR